MAKLDLHAGNHEEKGSDEGHDDLDLPFELMALWRFGEGHTRQERADNSRQADVRCGRRQAKARAEGHNPRAIIEASRELHQALHAIGSGVFSPDDPNRFTSLVDGLYQHDWFMVAGDFDAYAQAQREIDQIWMDEASWFSKAVRNTARMGWFSSDRTIRQYAKVIWKAG